ncbi:MAG: hypothetical protein HC803_10310, partial [Saprospiraceae bacterium]|nr:hypothetical protein [Saprospiraceae bacterium]
PIEPSPSTVHRPPSTVLPLKGRDGERVYTKGRFFILGYPSKVGHVAVT